MAEKVACGVPAEIEHFKTGSKAASPESDLPSAGVRPSRTRIVGRRILDGPQLLVAQRMGVNVPGLMRP